MCEKYPDERARHTPFGKLSKTSGTVNLSNGLEAESIEEHTDTILSKEENKCDPIV